MKDKITAIVLAAGQGRRMESGIQKQYMEVNGRPLITYALEAFENSIADQIVLVVRSGEEEYGRELAAQYGFLKVTCVVAGGEERWLSVYQGLLHTADADYVLIHDGARPCVTTAVIAAAVDEVRKYGAVVAGMPVKDTVKVVDQEDVATETLDRSKVWMVQTPQAFSRSLIFEAYSKLMESEQNQAGITDDAMVVERMTDHRIKLIRGSYENIKVTTPEDIAIVEALLGRPEKGPEKICKRFTNIVDN